MIRKCSQLLIVSLLVQLIAQALGTSMSQASAGDGYLTFKYETFSQLDQVLQLNRAAQIDNDQLVLTPAAAQTGGSAFNRERISLKDERSFSTYFTFQLTQGGGYSSGWADGFVFTVQTDSNSAGSIGGTLGYHEVAPSVGIKFDTWQNSEHGDQSRNHIAVLKNGVLSDALAYQDIDEADFNFRDSSVHHVWIDYNGPTGEMEVRLSKSISRPASPVLQHTFDSEERLMHILGPQNVFVGFTAATGGAYQQHSINSWYFSNEFNPIDIEHNNYVQAPVSYTIAERALPDGTVELTVTAQGGENNDVPITVTASNGAVMTPSQAETGEHGAVIIASSPDGSTRQTDVVVEGPGGIVADRTITIPGRTSAPAPNQIAANATDQVVDVTGVPEGMTVRVYDHMNALIASRANVTGGEASFTELNQVITVTQSVYVTFQRSPQVESLQTSVVPKQRSQLQAEDVFVNATTDQAVIQRVSPAATIRLYNAVDVLIGNAANTGQSIAELAVAIDAPGVTVGQSVYATLQNPNELESYKVEVVAREPVIAVSRAPILPDVLEIDVNVGTIKMGNVPAGAEIIIYDHEGVEIARGINSSLTDGEATVASVPLTERRLIGITYQEPAKLESTVLHVDIEAFVLDEIDDATRELEIGYQQSDTWESVTLPLLVVTVGKHHTEVSWTSSKPDSVEIGLPQGDTIEAQVHRQEADESVILTARVSKNGFIKTRTFLVIVKAANLSKTVETNRRIIHATGGENGNIEEPLSLDRISMSNGSTIDKVILSEAAAQQLVNQPATHNRVISVNMTLVPGDESDELAIEIPQDALHLLANNGNSLEIRTGYGTLSIDASVLLQMNDNFLDLFFRIVPVKDADRQRSIAQQIVGEQAVQSEAANRRVELPGSSFEIQTNYSGYTTTLFVPFASQGITIPAANTDSFLNALRIFIAHSDGDKVVEEGVAVYENGSPTGLSILIDKFSMFSILRFKERSSSETAINPESRGEQRVQAKSAIIADDRQTIVLELDQEGYAFVPANFVVTINGEQAAIKEVVTDGFHTRLILEQRVAPGYRVLISYEPFFNDLQAPNFAYHHAYIQAYEDGRFRPDDTVTRAEVATMLVRSQSLDTDNATGRLYPDVPQTHWASAYIEQLQATGLMIGYTDGRFRPEDRVTRAEMAMIAAKWLQADLFSNVGETPFHDVSDQHWSRAAISAAYRGNIMIGFEDGTFGAEQFATRAQTVAIINRLLQRRVTAADHMDVTWPDVPVSHWGYGYIQEASRDHYFMYGPDDSEQWFLSNED